MIGRYRKRPVVIDAVQFTEGQAFPDWLTDARMAGKVTVHLEIPGGNYLIIDTLEGKMRADQDDWIIRGIQGEIYPCKPDIFAASYEAVAA